MKGKLKKIIGTNERPRLRPTITVKHIYAQLIDDIGGKTIVAASTLDKELKKEKQLKPNKESAKIIGALIAKRAKAKGIDAAVFDRGKRRYHGVIKELADSARAGGLKF